MNILYLSSWFPFPPTNGTELRSHALLHGLAARHEVTLLSFQRAPATDEDIDEARSICRQVILIPWREFDPGSMRAYAGFLSRKPRSVVGSHSAQMALAIRQQVTANRHDLVIASRLGTAAYASEFGTVPAILEEIELGIMTPPSEGYKSVSRRLRHKLMWTKHGVYVRELLPRFAACTVVSDVERQLLHRIAPAYDRVEIIPNCIRYSQYAAINAERNANTLIFTGAFTYDVNYAAMVWFLSEVYPLVRSQVPQVQLIITGDHAGLDLPSGEGVTLTGHIEDVRLVVAGAAVSLAPLLQGGGTRLKVLEAMALGTPVVATTKGAEGLRVAGGEHLLLADSAESFAAATISLLQSATLREKIAKSARELVSRDYNWEVVMPSFLDLVNRVAMTEAALAV